MMGEAETVKCEVPQFVADREIPDDQGLTRLLRQMRREGCLGPAQSNVL